MTRRCTPPAVDPTRAHKLDHRTDYLPSQQVLCSQLRPFVLDALANDPSLLSRLDPFHVAQLERFAVAASSHEQTQALLPLVGLGRHPNVSFLTKVGFNYHAEGAEKALINTCPEVCTCPAHQGPYKMEATAASTSSSSLTSPSSTSSTPTSTSGDSMIAASAASALGARPAPIYNCFNRFRDYVYQTIEDRDLMDDFVADPCFIPRCHNKLSLIALIRICMRFEIDYSAYFQWAEYRGLNGPSSTTRFKRNRAAAARAAAAETTPSSAGNAVGVMNNTTAATTAKAMVLSSGATSATAGTAGPVHGASSGSFADFPLQSTAMASHPLAMHPSDFRLAAVLAAAAAVASAPHQQQHLPSQHLSSQQLLRHPFVQRIQETAAAISAVAQSALPALSTSSSSSAASASSSTSTSSFSALPMSVQSTLPGVRPIAMPVQRTSYQHHQQHQQQQQQQQQVQPQQQPHSSSASPSYTLFQSMVNPFAPNTYPTYSQSAPAAPHGVSVSSLGYSDDASNADSTKRLRVYAPADSLPSRPAPVYASQQVQQVQQVQPRYVSVVQVDAHPPATHDSYLHPSPLQQQPQSYLHAASYSAHGTAPMSSSGNNTGVLVTPSSFHNELSSPVVAVGRSLVPSSNATARSAPITVVSGNEASLTRYVSYDSNADALQQPQLQQLQQQHSQQPPQQLHQELPQQQRSRLDSTSSSIVSTPASTQSGGLPTASVSHDASPVSTSSNCTYVSTLADSPDHLQPHTHAHSHFDCDEVSPAPFLSSSASTGAVVSSVLPPSQWYTNNSTSGVGASAFSSSALKTESTLAPSSSHSLFPSSSFLHLGSAANSSGSALDVAGSAAAATISWAPSTSSFSYTHSS